MNQSEYYLSEIDRVREAELPEKVLCRAKRSLLDYLAVTCAGAAFQSEKTERYLAFAMPEEGRFRAIGTGRDLALKEAVFLNGLNAHALDYDDGTNSGIIHLGSPVFSLLIPLAQRYGIRTEELLKAAVAGYEASYTMAVSIQPGHKALGYHATGTCGTLGAALAAAYMLGFSAEERFQTFAAACVAASGMLKALDEGSELKPYNVAKTALLSLTALQLAKAGFRGSPDPLGGRGFLKMMTGREDTALKPVLLNGSYAIMKSYTKPYASCRFTHPAVEAAIRLRGRVPLEETVSIEVRTYGLAVSGHDHTEVAGSYSAKMSIPYSVAAGFVFGRAGLQEFTGESISDERLRRLASAVCVSEDEALSAAFPEKQAAIVTIRTADGKMLTERVDYPKGEPENPLTEEEFRLRYDGLMAYAGVETGASDEVFRMVNRGDTAVSDLVRRL